MSVESLAEILPRVMEELRRRKDSVVSDQEAEVIA